MKTGLRIMAGGLLLAILTAAGFAREPEEPQKEFVPLVRIRLLNSELIGDEKVSAPGISRQVFKFMGRQAAWQVTPSPGRLGWTAFCFTRPLDLSGLRADAVLSFAMAPADMDDRVGIAIGDRLGNVSEVRPMSECRSSVLNNRGVYLVPVAGESLDWTGVSEVRLVILKTFDERVAIRIQNLLMEPRAWGRP